MRNRTRDICYKDSPIGVVGSENASILPENPESTRMRLCVFVFHHTGHIFWMSCMSVQVGVCVLV